MTSKRDRKCMANKSIDRRVALRLNSWQSGALGKLWASADMERRNQRSPACCAAHPIVSGALRHHSRAKVDLHFNCFLAFVHEASGAGDRKYFVRSDGQSLCKLVNLSLHGDSKLAVSSWNQGNTNIIVLLGLCETQTWKRVRSQKLVTRGIEQTK